MEKLLQNLRRTVSKGNLVPTSLPLAPSVELYLLSADYPKGPLAQEEMLAILNSPAYWCFCWASGQAMAAYLLGHPTVVRGKLVADFGTGSGVVAIAAALAGAREVVAIDIDEDALDAARANAERNGVRITTAHGLEQLAASPEVILAADVLYDRDNYHFLEQFPALAPLVVLADSRMKEDQIAGYELITTITTTTMPDIGEQAGFNRVRIHRSGR